MCSNSVKNLRQSAVSKLLRSGIFAKREASIEADMLIEYISGVNKKDIILNPDKELNQEQADNLDSLINRRINERIPVQYLIHKAYFMGKEFYVDENVLIPRPETELLVEEALKLIKDNSEIIDIGTGSGCIACMIALKSEFKKLVASDISEKALNIAKINVKNLNIVSKIEFKHSDILTDINQEFDLIISNPPYIPISEKDKLQYEVSEFEPGLALFAPDEKGIFFYERLIEQSRSKLKPGGHLIMEIGISQSRHIKQLLEKANFVNISIIKDYNNIDRILIGQM